MNSDVKEHIRDPRARDWRKQVSSRLGELFDLEKGWDGYEAPAVSTENGAFALAMLEAICDADAPTPQIVPGTDGDLQIEWHLAQSDIELHVLGPGKVHAWRKLDGLTIPDEIDVSDDFSVMTRWMQQLSESISAAATTAA